MRTIHYRDRIITKLFPSGMFETYLRREGRFWKFSEIEDAERAIDEDCD